jgi:hypothetical protein
MVSGRLWFAAPVGRPYGEGVVVVEYPKMLAVFDASLKGLTNRTLPDMKPSVTPAHLKQAKTTRSRNDT